MPTMSARVVFSKVEKCVPLASVFELPHDFQRR
jgi:hypothetical protein